VCAGVKIEEMKIKWSGIGITDGRGAVGGNIASRNASGAYVRKNTMPVSTTSDRQALVRATFATFSQLWRGLTFEQQKSFKDGSPSFPYVNRMGESQTYTGQQLFNKLNLNARKANAAAPLIENCPVAVEVPGAEISVLVATRVGGILTVLDFQVNFVGTPPAGLNLVVYATPPLGNGITSPSKSDFRQIVSTPMLAGTFDLSADYADTFGDIAFANSRIFVRAEVVLISTGQTSYAGQSSVSVV